MSKSMARFVSRARVATPEEETHEEVVVLAGGSS
jgi:hypothetical protein